MKVSITLTAEGEDDYPVFSAVIAQLRKDWATPDGAPGAEIDEAIEVPGSGTWDRNGVDGWYEGCYPGHRTIVTRIATDSLNGGGTAFNELLEMKKQSVDDPSYDFNNFRADLAWISKYARQRTERSGP